MAPWGQSVPGAPGTVRSVSAEPNRGRSRRISLAWSNDTPCRGTRRLHDPLHLRFAIRRPLRALWTAALGAGLGVGIGVLISGPQSVRRCSAIPREPTKGGHKVDRGRVATSGLDLAPGEGSTMAA